jgi:hypothetical protein
MTNNNTNLSSNESTIKKSNWQKYVIIMNEEVKMSSPLLQYAVNKFKTEIVHNLADNQFYYCQLQCNFHIMDEDKGLNHYIYRSISYLQFFMKNGPKEASMLNVFWHFWCTFYEDRYKLFLVKSICIFYKVIPTQYNYLISSEDIKDNINPKPLVERINKTLDHAEETEIKLEPSEILKYKNHSGYNLPLTMDITKWGYTIFNEDYTSAICWGYNINKYKNIEIKTAPVLYDYDNSLPEFLIEIKDLQLYTRLIIKGNELFSFEDTIWSLNQQIEGQAIFQNIPLGQGESILKNFTRTIKNTRYLFIDGEEQFMIKDKKVNFITSKKNKDSFKGTNFITMDLETKTINGVLTPYCVSIFNGKTVSSFYITELNLLKGGVKKVISFYFKRLFLQNS